MIERTVVIFKPDAVNRGLVGEILQRFEHKGLKIIGLKMVQLEDAVLDLHYAHHKDKEWFAAYKDFMKSAPVLISALEGNNAVSVVRKLAGSTHGAEAPPGTIRGDFSVSQSHNIVHAPDSAAAAKVEFERFFEPQELFPWQKIDWAAILAEEERT